MRQIGPMNAVRREPIAGLFVVGALVAGLLLGPACESTSSNSTPDAGGNVILSDNNNYAATGALTIPSIETAPGADLDICWSGLNKDLLCHDVNPMAQIDNVGLIRFRLSEADVQARLSTGMVAMSETTGYLEHRTDKTSTCAKLFAFTFLGTMVDVKSMYTEPASANESYMMVFTQGVQTGVGARSMAFLRPKATSTNTTVNASPGCGLLAFQANLASLEKVPVPTTGPWIVDWRALTKDGQGNPVVFQNIDGLLLGFYEGMSVADIQAKIFDLEQIATSVWDLKLAGGRTANLAMATERTTGAAFTGFQRSTPGIWMLGLTCSRCQNPAPIVLTVLEPGAGSM